MLASVSAKQLEESPKKHVIYSLHEVRSLCVLKMGEATIRISEQGIVEH
jgi:hypothetical protein